MKKLTFIEALKVNETRIVNRNVRVGYIIYKPNELKSSDHTLRELYKSEFFTEPEKFEFECNWILNGSVVYPNCSAVLAESFLGKRTKVTVEVIEND
jgi:hypothetical protein